MSRSHFHRRLPKTRKAMETLTTTDSSQSILYDFSRYHTVGMNTGPNTRALWAGLDEQSKTAEPIWETFESSGYVAGRADPMCQDWNAYYNPSHFPSDQKIIKKRISHEHIAFSCLPSIVPRGKENAGNFAGPASIKARCFSDTHVGWHILDWCKSFIERYRGRVPYFVVANFMEAHEGSGEVLSTLDERLARLFEREGEVDWENTVVAVLSDHGALMGLNNAFFENGRVEAKNPFAAFVMPRGYMMEGSGKRNENMREAAGELVTAFDFWETFRGLLGPKAKEEMGRGRGRDLMREKVGSRSCEEVGIDSQMCQCK